MRPIETGMEAVLEVATDRSHTAAAVGNPGVAVVSTTALILMLEDAAHRAIASSFEDGEGSLGTHVDVRHLAPAAAGAVITARARVTAVAGRRITFAIEARHGERLLMAGCHERVVVDLARFLAREGIVPQGSGT